MDFELSQEQLLLKKTIKNFTLKEIHPNAAHRDESAEFPWELIPKIAALNLLGIFTPQEYGGAGMGAMEAAIILEEIARIDGSLALIVASHNSLCSSHILRFGNDAQKKKYLPLLATGKTLGAWGLTEPESGSDAGALAARAALKNNQWTLNGRKQFITQGSTAGVYVIMARTTGQNPDGVSAFIVEKGTPGFST
ncbi:MAG: acyl-CoA dehydrogenase family protein, partial [Nitrospirae bacterium]|nr:acyl-CoA dehydrogenase family protein [Nitrospirota bacterium]